MLSQVIQTYSLVDTLLQVQNYVQNGYRVDVESNEGYPQLFGNMFVVTMLKDESKEVPKMFKEQDIKSSFDNPVVEPADEIVQSTVPTASIATDTTENTKVQLKLSRKPKH